MPVIRLVTFCNGPLHGTQIPLPIEVDTDGEAPMKLELVSSFQPDVYLCYRRASDQDHYFYMGTRKVTKEDQDEDRLPER